MAWTAVAPCKTRGVTVELNHEIRLPASVVLAFTQSREPVAQKNEFVLPRGLVLTANAEAFNHYAGLRLTLSHSLIDHGANIVPHRDFPIRRQHKGHRALGLDFHDDERRDSLVWRANIDTAFSLVQNLT